MKIRDDNGMQRGVPIHPQSVKGSRSDPSAHANPSERPLGDRVELSDRARALQAAKEALAKLPEIRKDKVEKLKQMVKTDAYRVRSFEVAGRMLGDALFG